MRFVEQLFSRFRHRLKLFVNVALIQLFRSLAVRFALAREVESAHQLVYRAHHVFRKLYRDDGGYHQQYAHRADKQREYRAYYRYHAAAGARQTQHAAVVGYRVVAVGLIQRFRKALVLALAFFQRLLHLLAVGVVIHIGYVLVAVVDHLAGRVDKSNANMVLLHRFVYLIAYNGGVGVGHSDYICRIPQL